LLATGTTAANPESSTSAKTKTQNHQQNLRTLLTKKSNERILVIGDGNFSFSASLIDLFGGDASKIVATCYDSEEILHQKYSDAAQHIERIKDSGGTVLFDVDGTK
jgi:25S rRNA (uracil2634-N3)-methyltransferase